MKKESLIYGIRKKLIKLLAGCLSIILIFVSGVFFYDDMDLITSVGIKMQRLRGGEWKTFGDLYAANEAVAVVGQIVEGTVVEQEFEFTEGMLEYDILCFAVYAATYNRINKGTISFLVEQDDYSYKYDMDMSSVKDNDYIKFLVDTSKFKPGKAVIKCYSDEATPGNAITVYITTCIGYSDSVEINDVEMPYNLKMKIYVPF